MKGIIEEVDTNARTFMLCGYYDKKDEKTIINYFKKNTKLNIKEI